MKIFSNIHKGIPTLLKGIGLWENKNRDDDQQKAYQSFKSMIQSILLLLIGGFLIYVLLSNILFKDSGKIVRIGSRQNNEIIYVYKDVYKMDYDSSMLPLKEKEKVAVYIDPKTLEVSSLQNYEEYEKQNNKKSTGLLILILSEGILIVAGTLYILKRKGRDFFEWSDAQKGQ